MTPTQPEPTQIGAYHLVRPIGSGGMGAVWLARHAMIGREAAIKLLHPSLSARHDIVTRFFNEARAASSIADPGIVQIFDFGYHTDGSAYIVMELLDGEPLDERLRRHGRLPVGDALRILRQVAASLGVAHARGIVHRDLKPENIFLTRDAEVSGGERAKLLDFGIAKLSRDADTGVVTQTDAILGTPTYMSPEQCRGAGDVDLRSDVYALGCVAYALVAGEPPFVAEGAGEIIAMHLREPAPRASVKAPWIPSELDDIIARCLAKDPDHRIGSATELARMFDALLARASVAEARGSAASARLPASKTTLTAATGAVASPAARPRWRVAIALATGVAIAAAVATFGIARLSTTDETFVLPPPPPMPAVRPVPSPAPPSPVPSKPDAIAAPTPREQTAPMIVAGLEAFRRWAASHAGAPCPTAGDLGDPRDAWGHVLVVTCNVQPEDQQIGLVSVGPDGTQYTDDDVESWKLAEHTRVAGPRWQPQQVARPAAVKPRPKPAPVPAPPAPSPATNRGVPTEPEPASPPTPCKPSSLDRDGDCFPDKR